MSSNKKLSKKQLLEHKEHVAGKIDNEGLGYWLTNYFDPNDIIEEEVREACQQASDWLRKADDLLEEHGYRL